VVTKKKQVKGLWFFNPRASLIIKKTKLIKPLVFLSPTLRKIYCLKLIKNNNKDYQNFFLRKKSRFFFKKSPIFFNSFLKKKNFFFKKEINNFFFFLQSKERKKFFFFLMLLDSMDIFIQKKIFGYLRLKKKTENRQLFMQKLPPSFRQFAFKKKLLKYRVFGPWNFKLKLVLHRFYRKKHRDIKFALKKFKRSAFFIKQLKEKKKKKVIN
jgi:hypothetical protein